VLAGEPADHLRAPADLPERALEQVRAPPLAPVSERILQMDQEPVEIVGEAGGRGDIPLVGELADQRAHPPLAVLDRVGLIQRLPVGGADPLALPLGQLRQEIPEAMDRAALTVRLRPALLDRVVEPGGAVGDDQLRTR
jgi:hypothetical protein